MKVKIKKELVPLSPTLQKLKEKNFVYIPVNERLKILAELTPHLNNENVNIFYGIISDTLATGEPLVINWE